MSLHVNVMFSVEALVGHRSRSEGLASSPSVVAQAMAGAQGILLGDEAMAPGSEEWGTLAAAASGRSRGWGRLGPGQVEPGALRHVAWLPRDGKAAAGMFGFGGAGPASEATIAGTLGADIELGPQASGEVVFVLGWNFPNRRSWVKVRGRGACRAATPSATSTPRGLANAWDIVSRHVPRLGELEALTQQFVSAFWSSDLSPVVKEAALFNLSTLGARPSSATADGCPFGWEGCLDDAGSCLGSCTHVWNYELATGFLFAAIARQMREFEFLHATAEDGAMSFRIMLPLDKARELPLPPPTASTAASQAVPGLASVATTTS